MEYNDEEVVLAKHKMFITTTLSIIIVLVLFTLAVSSSIRSCSKDISKHKYYVLEITEENKNDVITILQNENIKYCETMYKIEYEKDSFNNRISGKIYCKDEENSFNIDYNNNLMDFIYKNGVIEKR